jgi:hypothetical protein
MISLEPDFRLRAHLNSVVLEMPAHSIEELKSAGSDLAVGFHLDFETQVLYLRLEIHMDSRSPDSEADHSSRDYHYLLKKLRHLAYTYLRRLSHLQITN